MQHTLIAVFGNRADAQNAINALISSGFPQEKVRLSNADPTGMTDSTTGAGHHVLTVRADSLPEAERAADIVERFDPTDVDEGASQTGAMGIDTGGQTESVRTGARPHLDNPGDRKLFQQHSLNQSEPAGGTYQEPLGESGLGATGSTMLHASILRENAAHVSSLEDMETGRGGASPGSTRLTGTRRGRTRIYSPEPSSGTGGGSWLDIGSNFFGDDDDYYRNHFLANYSGEDYDHVKPAYSYGAEMRRSELYRNRPWDDVEGDLAHAWEARTTMDTGAGAPREGAWERIKAAVRHGWDRMTS